MKTTLTQAWEARGVHGMLLRSRVRDMLIERFYTDERRRWFAKDFMIAFVSVVILGVLFYFHTTLFLKHVLPIVDLSRTLDFLAVLAMGGAIVGPLAVIVYALVIMVKDLAAIGYIDRYIFEHRDDEVNL
ncbi:hypothetical protein HY493_00020 [Candidatus Woesearchaeota archaeon]|nr:hypothetical protein [Candidatus Woesearchaeota archaeon]